MFRAKLQLLFLTFKYNQIMCMLARNIPVDHLIIYLTSNINFKVRLIIH